MKLREAYEQQCKTTVELRDALKYLVIGGVDWTTPAMIATVGGMPKKMIRFGLVQSSEPFIIVHDVDGVNVWIVTPDQAANMPWPVVDSCPKLRAFLLKNVDTDKITIHMPGDAWVRKVNVQAHGG